MTQDRDQGMPCPACDGTAPARSVRIDGPVKLITYECERCGHRVEDAERWKDEWWTAGGGEPSTIWQAAEPRGEHDG